jgi:hypothetical protein
MKKKLGDKITHRWQEYDQLVGGGIFHEKKQADRKKEPDENKLPLFLLINCGTSKKGPNKIASQGKHKGEYTGSEPTQVGLVRIVGVGKDNRPNL